MGCSGFTKILVKGTSIGEEPMIVDPAHPRKA
jgi:hypothetical protein